jgi:hypothetical protein
MDEESARALEEMRALFATMTAVVSEDQLAVFVAQAGLVPPGKRAQDLPPWPSWVKHRRSLRTGGAAWAHQDRAERLRAFERPVLLVTGHGTAHFLRRITDALATTFPRARVIELDGGHAPQIVEMARFLDELTRFQGAE